MNANFKITKGTIVIISLFLYITILQSCDIKNRKSDNYSKAIELTNEGAQLMQRMEYDSALVFFKKAIRKDKNYYISYSYMTGVYISKKQYDKALKVSNKLIKIKPDLAEGWTLAGMLYDWQGDSIAAAKNYKKSIELFNDRINNPDEQKDLFANKLNRAISFILVGQDKKGKDDLEKLKAENPDYLMIDEFIKMSKRDIIKQTIDNQ
ncbi:tetratricopeptide repeat protein [Saccharicrinis sp. FJH54]|uniref:tetratricopeptide repeat protein n=1 Tax=Saccharicrinis sp. FJH54 TaxID=3344665 RepID=UPI0035D5153B